ncbi:hypothetical protein [Streptomyces sp. H27-C3]|uniref:hypothetical protein n=1 Tax=Streptomyces sp. H27-C3 TaxID=3046305 RepID=UPI0024B8B315|nr:hypothetical protein [Streptomyces sp. H27-C3]MDJ0460217.1 hypothetical protein [Streptomyces sp. H27-C3]
MTGQSSSSDHVATVGPKMWGEFGPGAVGFGWDLALRGLYAHLRGESFGPDWQSTPQAGEFMTLSSRAWGVAHEASGALAPVATAAAENTAKAYVPER